MLFAEYFVRRQIVFHINTNLRLGWLCEWSRVVWSSGENLDLTWLPSLEELGSNSGRRSKSPASEQICWVPSPKIAEMRMVLTGRASGVEAWPNHRPGSLSAVAAPLGMSAEG